MTQNSTAGTGAVRVGVLGAMMEEMRVTLERLGLKGEGGEFVGRAGAAEVVAVVSGIGAERSKAALEKMAGRGVGRVLNVGFAGGLDPQLAAGTVLEVGWVVSEGGERYRVSGGGAPEGIANCQLPTANCQTEEPHRTLLTLDRVADTVERKRELFNKHRAGAVDMESFHVARWCAERGVALTVLRVVSDPADVAIPAVATQWVRPDGTVDVNAATAYVLTRPWLMPSFMRLQGHARLAAARLADAVASRF